MHLKTLYVQISANLLFLRLQLFFLLPIDTSFSSDVRNCPENGKNRKEIKWLLMASPRIFRVGRAFYCWRFFYEFLFQKIWKKILHLSIQLGFFHLWGVAHKSRPKVKNGGQKARKSYTKPGIMWLWDELLPIFLH